MTPRRPRDIGTRVETALVRAAVDVGIPAYRTALTGGDVGDVHLRHGQAVVQCKGGQAAETASWGRLARWWQDTEAQAERVTQCDLAVLVVKRRGCGSAGDWTAWLRVDEWVWVTKALEVPLPQVVGMPVQQLLAGLAAAGWAAT